MRPLAAVRIIRSGDRMGSKAILSLEEADQAYLIGLQRLKSPLGRPLPSSRCLQKRTIKIGLQHGRMYVTLATHGCGISQPLGDRPNGSGNISPGLSLRLRMA